MEKIIDLIEPANQTAMKLARNAQNNFIKPQGSLGVLEDIAVKFAGITGKLHNSINNKIIFLFGSDHGIYDEGVSSAPQSFTRGLMNIYSSTQDAAINILTRQNGIDLKLLDLGIKKLGILTRGVDFSHKHLDNGTANFLKFKAMKIYTTRNFINDGIDLIEEYIRHDYNLFGMGEVGMGNTTPATACIMAVLKEYDPALVGRGAGLSDEALEIKRDVIKRGLEKHWKDFDKDPVYIPACVGGPEIAAMVGIFLGCAYFNVPAIVDGITSIAAALVACEINPNVRDYIFLSNRSTEPAFSAAAEKLGLTPPLELNMRLGEGTGCAVMMPLIEDALAIMNNMRSFKNNGNL